MHYEFTDETREFHGRTLRRIRCAKAIPAFGVAVGDVGGWVETEANLTQSGRAWVYPNAVVCDEARAEGGTFRGGTFEGGTFWGGTFEGGTFWGGTFWGGTFWGGTFWGGTFEGGTFEGGTFRGGTFEGGTFGGGTFEGGTFEGGTFEGGTFRGGTFEGGTFRFALTAQRSDGYVFTVNPTDDVLRVAAGCRYFTFPEAREHWARTRGGTLLGDETMDILDFLERQAQRCGLAKETEA